MVRYPRSKARIALYGVLIGAVYALDIVTALDLNIPILYLVPLLAAFLLEDVRLRLGLTALVTALTIIVVPPVWSDTGHLGLFNRGLDLGVFFVALALSIRDAHNTGELKDLKHAIDKASIVIVADSQGIIRHVNERLCEISKYDRDELVGRDWRVLNAGPERDDGLWSTVASGHIWHGEIEHRAKDGETFLVAATITPFLGPGGQPYQYFFISNDITDRSRADARLRHQAALAKIGEMAAFVAHEVRNPLAGVRAGLQLLDGRLALPAAEKLAVQRMVERLDLLNAHVTDLLRFARPRSPRLEAVNLKALIDETAQLVLRTGTPETVAWRIVGPETPALGDRGMLCEIFTNLFVNAGQAVNGNGEVVVTLSRQDDALDVIVTDNGSGIPAAIHERVFEPFYTTKPGGTGLGLAIVKQLVDLHGGRTEIVSSSPSGTTIRVRLPCARGVTAQACPVSA